MTVTSKDGGTVNFSTDPNHEVLTMTVTGSGPEIQELGPPQVRLRFSDIGALMVAGHLLDTLREMGLGVPPRPSRE